MFKKKKPSISERQRPVQVNKPQTSVFSYYAANKAVQSTPGSSGKRSARDNESVAIKTRQTNPNATKRRLMWAGLAILLVLALFNTWLATDAQLVVTQSPGSMLMRPQQAYAQATQTVLAQNLGSRTKLTINSQKTAQELQTKFPELDSVHVKVPFIGQKPIVVLTPSAPSLLLITKDGGSYILDSNGRAVSKVSQTTAAVRALPVVQDQSSLGFKLGAIALPGPSVDFITEVVAQLKAKQLTISNMVLPMGSNSLELKTGAELYIVKFNLMGSARVEAGAYLAVKQKLDTENKKPGSYIDVRAESRAYYK